MSEKAKNIAQVLRYRCLVNELVLRDLKVKYRRSFLGYVWSLLNPILMMLVMTLVFSNILRGNIENFPLYVICGSTLFSFFNESTSMAMQSIVSNAALLKKIRIPKMIFPISRVLSCFVTMLFSLLAIVIVMIFSGATFHITILLSVFPILFLLIFCCGMGMLLSSLSVYFRDITHLYGVLLTAWMYCTPVFYSFDMLPTGLQPLMQFNPMYHFVTFFRSVVISGVVPGVDLWLSCLFSSVLFFVLGMLVFNKLQKRFILYI